MCLVRGWEVAERIQKMVIRFFETSGGGGGGKPEMEVGFCSAVK